MYIVMHMGKIAPATDVMLANKLGITFQEI